MNKGLFWLVAFIAVVSIAGNGLLYERYSSHRPLIDVNDQVIRVKDLQDRLDYLYSNTVLRQMILQDLIIQEATKEGVMPTDDDLTAAKQSLQRSDPTVLSQAAATDPTMKLFDQQLMAKLALRNIGIKNIKVSEAEIDAYYNTHKAEFTLPKQAQTTVIYAKDSVGADTATSMLHNGVSLQVIAQQPGLMVAGINTKNIGTVPPEVVQQVLAMNTGDIKTFPVDNYLMVVQAKSVDQAGVQPLALVHDQVELAAKAAKAPTEQVLLARLVRAAHITVESDKYAGAVPQISADAASTQ